VELQEFYTVFRDIGAEVIAVSVDTEENAVAVVEKLGLEYPVLYDTTHEVTMAWHVFNVLQDGVSAPAAYVFDAQGTLVAYKIASNISDRPTASELLNTLRTH
jgi:peroxiredoxin